MKIIKNEETKIIDGSKNPATCLSRADLLKIVINDPPQGGFTIAEMRDRLRIFGTLSAAGVDTIELEDADFKILKERFDAFRWAQVHEDIVSLADHLASLV